MAIRFAGNAVRWMSCVAVVAVLAIAPRSAAAEPEWKVGLARVKITPERPVFLAGYASRNKPFTKVEADLYAKALVLEDREGHRAVLVTSDLVGFPAAVAEPICRRLREKAGLKREQILLNSSHTHTGPMLTLNGADGDGLTPAELQRNVEYTRQLQDKIVELVQRAMAHLEPARLSRGVGVVPFVMNRREFTPKGVILGVNPRGHADRSAPVLRIDTPEGKLRAVLFGAAVHGTTLTGQHYELCGDYAGFAQAYIEDKHPSVQAMFLIGCAGDANPYPRGTMELAREHGATLGKEVCRVLESKLRPVRGPLRLAFDQAALPLQAPPSREELRKQAAGKGGMQAWIAKRMLAVLDRGDKLPTHYNCPVAVWQFDEDLTLVALSGEVVVDYVGLLEKALGPNQLWLAAYCNDVFGYLPSARVLREGGYETRGLYTGGIGLFDAKVQDLLVAKVRELAGKVGRALPSKPDKETRRQGDKEKRTGVGVSLSGLQDAAKLQQIDGVVAEAIEQGRLPGAVVLVVHQGKIVFRKAYGLRSKQPAEVRMTVDTVFDLASLTKPIATATSIMVLVEQGKFRLSDRVARHLEDFGQGGKERITVEQLLLHTSGLIADNPVGDYKDGRKKALERMCRLQPLTEPGVKFLYSDVNFILLGELVERISGESLDVFARKHVFEPLGMRETTFRPEKALAERAAPTEKRDGRWMRGEVHDPRAYLLGGVAGHAGLFSTADDLAVFAQMILNQGSYAGQRILRPATVRLMTTPRPVPGGLRALGWDVRTRFSSNRGDGFSADSFGHTGFTGTSIWIDPSSQTAVIFLSNRVHPDGKGQINRLRGRVASLVAAGITN